jgi:hypothetical protein
VRLQTFLKAIQPLYGASTKFETVSSHFMGLQQSLKRFPATLWGFNKV